MLSRNEHDWATVGSFFLDREFGAQWEHLRWQVSHTGFIIFEHVLLGEHLSIAGYSDCSE